MTNDMPQVHIGQHGTKTVIPAGYLNRAARRRWQKIMRKDKKHKGVRIY